MRLDVDQLPDDTFPDIGPIPVPASLYAAARRAGEDTTGFFAQRMIPKVKDKRR